MSNDYFNLNSSTDEEDDEEAKEKEKAIRKWDWDREENYDLYFGKRTIDASSTSTTGNKKIKTETSSLCAEKPTESPHIERVQTPNSSNLIYNLVGHSATVNRVHWKRSNKQVLLSSSMDKKIVVWDLSNPNSSRSVKVYENVHAKSIRNAVWSLNQTEIVSIGYDQTCALTDIETGNQKNRFETNEFLTAVCVHLTDENLVLVGAKNCIYSWDIREKDTKKMYKAPMGQVQDLACLNEHELVSCGDVVNKESAQYAIIVWDVASGARLSDQLYHEKYACTSLAVHPRRARVFYAQTHGNYIVEFVGAGGASKIKMNRHKRFDRPHRGGGGGYYLGCHVNASGRLIASGSSDGRAYVYNVDTSELVSRIDAFVGAQQWPQSCMDAKFSPPDDTDTSTSLLATSSWNGLIKVFEI